MQIGRIRCPNLQIGPPNLQIGPIRKLCLSDPYSVFQEPYMLLPLARPRPPARPRLRGSALLPLPWTWRLEASALGASPLARATAAARIVLLVRASKPISAK